MAEWAVIFDVDGVLLELTQDEEEVFFTALSKYVPTHELSRDWNSYRIRNDDDIIAEILDRNGLPQTLKQNVIADYIILLRNILRSDLKSVAIVGAHDLLPELANRFTLGIATANLLDAASARLQQVGLWRYVSANAQGADGGGHKSIILQRLLNRMPVPRSNIIYIGDNLNDLEAARKNRVHFIGFSTNAHRRQILAANGAERISADHVETQALIARHQTRPS